MSIRIADRRSRSVRSALAIAAPILSAATLGIVLVRTAVADDGPPTLGVGNVVTEFDATTETFSVFRALAQDAPRIDGKATKMVIVDHPAESRYTVTGRVRGEVSFVSEPPRFTHDFALHLDFWSNGKKVGSHETTCRGETPANGPDYRFEALAPCVHAQLAALQNTLAGK